MKEVISAERMRGIRSPEFRASDNRDETNVARLSPGVLLADDPEHPRSAAAERDGSRGGSARGVRPAADTVHELTQNGEECASHV